MAMKILHSSDWHLGKHLFKRRRRDIIDFLTWFEDRMREEEPDVVIVAGDIFDTLAPPHEAGQWLYSFLGRVQDIGTTIVLVAGNHDSFDYLELTQGLLDSMRIHVVGHMKKNPREALIPIYKLSDVRKARRGALDAQQSLPNTQNSLSTQRALGGVGAGLEACIPAGIVAAVPYLPESELDITLKASVEEKEREVEEHMQAYYELLAHEAQELKKERGWDKPEDDVAIVTTGHFFCAGSGSLTNDIRPLHIGTLVQIGVNVIFDEIYSYVAMGHIHSKKIIGGKQHIRYSGTPIPLTFEEGTKKKYILVVEAGANAKDTQVREIEVPRFLELVLLEGTVEELKAGLEKLVAANKRAWVDILCTETNFAGNLADELFPIVAKSQVDILRCRRDAFLTSFHTEREISQEELKHMSPHDICKEILEQQKDKLTQPIEKLLSCFDEIANAVEEKEMSKRRENKLFDENYEEAEA